MTALTRTPQNTNLLQPTKFLLTFDRLGSVQYFCQSANIPGMSLGQATYNTPFVDIPLAGNKLSYNPFNVSFTVDEKLDSWNQMNLWFRSIAAPTGFNERNNLSRTQNAYKSQGLKAYSDATLIVLSALNNPILRVHFINTFPLSISDIQFDTKESADNIITASASFAFEYFDIETV